MRSRVAPLIASLVLVASLGAGGPGWSATAPAAPEALPAQSDQIRPQWLASGVRNALWRDERGRRRVASVTIVRYPKLRKASARRAEALLKLTVTTPSGRKLAVGRDRARMPITSRKVMHMVAFSARESRRIIGRLPAAVPVLGARSATAQASALGVSIQVQQRTGSERIWSDRADTDFRLPACQSRPTPPPPGITGWGPRADLPGLVLPKVRLVGQNLLRANLSGAVFGNGTTLACSLLAEADLRSVSLRQAMLSYSNFTGADLTGADLAESNLSGSWLGGATLQEASLREVRAKEGSWRGADLRRADLSGASLTFVSLEGADLAGARLNGATLRALSLFSADLTGADLRGATFDGVGFTGTVFRNTICPNGERTPDEPILGRYETRSYWTPCPGLDGLGR